jgi:hypothetical protein
MAVINYFEPYYVGSGNQTAPVPGLYAPAPGAVWRRGAVLTTSTTGTITLPAPTGSMAALAGPAASAVTFGSSSSSGAPGGTYYVQVTYTASSNESLPSQEYITNVLPGYVPTITVASAGAPGAATNFAAYVSLLPGFEALQQASKTTTALGSAFTVANPLTNSTGIAGAATNASGSLVGIAENDSNEIFFSGTGGSIMVGNQSLLGATNSLPPLLPLEVPLAYVCKLIDNAIFEFSLRQTIAWSPTLVNAQVGLYLDATSGFYTVDTAQSNKVAYIIGPADGVQSVVGTTGDYGKRVQVIFLNSATL